MFRYQPIVCMHLINVKTNEPIGPNFFVATHITQRKVYGRIKVEIVPKKRQLNLFYRNVFRKVCNIINKRNKIGLVYCANAPQIFWKDCCIFFIKFKLSKCVIFSIKTSKNKKLHLNIKPNMRNWISMEFNILVDYIPILLFSMIQLKNARV